MTRGEIKDYITYVDGTYMTEKKEINFIIEKSTSFLFYMKLLKIIFRSSFDARKKDFSEKRFYDESYNVFKLLESVGVRFHITGIENLQKCNFPCVFVGNHMSTLETFILPFLLLPYTPISFVVKKSLVEYPVFGHIMKAVEPITVTRTNPREDLKTVLEEGVKKISKGRSIIVFPQTTRKVIFVPSEFNSIGVKLAKRINVPIMPIALKTDAWRNGKILKDFGPIDNKKIVYFAFGEPIYVKDKGDEAHQEVIKYISEKLENWKD